MKKFLITLLAVACLVCLGLAVACAEDVYYKITFKTDEGVSVVCKYQDTEIRSGDSIKAGSEITFTLVVDETVETTPLVTANGKVLQSDKNGVYKVVMNSDIAIVVASTLNTIKFDAQGNDWVEFLNTDGQHIETLYAVAGEIVTFKVKTSVYYEGVSYSVLAGAEVLSANEGIYSFEVSGPVTVKVDGLAIDLAGYTYLGRADGGEGTQENPYKIETALDLYTMVDAIADPWNVDGFYQSAYYSLENDIDMKGERLFIIGDTTTQVSYFAGKFLGNGHTISNYYITDTIIEQSGFSEVHLSNVGLFGYVYNAEIYDLNVKDFTIIANAAAFEEQTFAGGIVGYGIGLNMFNCSASGKIVIDGAKSYFSYAGGLVGFQQSFADENTVNYSVVQSCSSNVEVSCESGYVYAAGGISGYLCSFDEQTSAAILNCYSTGNVYGAMHAGGIAGHVNPFGSIKNCYATGIVEAYNAQPVALGNTQICSSYAGGIAGYVEYGSIISDSFFTGKTYAYAYAGNTFKSTDGIAGGIDGAGTQYIDTDAALVVNSYTTSSSKYGETKTINESFIKGTLGWAAEDWDFGGNGAYPVINKKEANKSFKITIDIDDGSKEGVKSEIAIDNIEAYIPMSLWYMVEGGIPRYCYGEGSLRTFGYYFDKALTQKVPSGYVPTDNMTLYAKYADYAEVAGDYFVKTSEGGNGVYITLYSDGQYIYREGALSYKGFYDYDGKTVVLSAGPASVVEITGNDGSTEYNFVSSKAQFELSNGYIVFEYKYEDISNNIIDSFTVVCEIAAFNYGAYFDGDGNEYVFYKDGTGEIVGVAGFTYTISDGQITVNRNGKNIICELSGGQVTSYGGKALTAYDPLMGVWEKSAGSQRQYEFDGKGNWSYKYFGYGSNGEEKIIGSAQGTYEFKEGKAELVDNNGANVATVSLENGLLKIDGETYYAQYSFKGTWRFTNSSDPVEIVFNGITANGLGTATARYLAYSNMAYEITYQAVVADNGIVYLALYNEYSQFGVLTFNSQTFTLTGTIVSSTDKNVNATFFLFDDYRGRWNNEQLGTFNFNGFGNYNDSGNRDYMEVKGTVTITEVGERPVTVDYTLDDRTLKGSFIYNDKLYTIELDEKQGIIEMQCEGEKFTLTRENGG